MTVAAPGPEKARCAAPGREEARWPPRLDKGRACMPFAAARFVYTNSVQRRPTLPEAEPMHAYRSHTCGALRPADVGQTVRLSGWIHRKRDHGHLLFVDLRDHYGLTQCVVDSSRTEAFAPLDGARNESVVTITGTCAARSPETVNAKLPTGGL